MTGQGVVAQTRLDNHAVQDGSPTVVTIEESSIDGKTAPVVRDRLRPVLAAAHNTILDLSKVTYLSSAGLRLLLLVYREVTAKNGTLVLVGVSDDIETTMSYTGFLGFFKLAKTTAEATRLLS